MIPSVSTSIYLVVIVLSPFTFACWSSSTPVDEDGNWRGIKPENKKIWNDWDPPSGANEAWDVWIDEWKKKKEFGGYLTKEEMEAGKVPAGGGIKGWPSQWIGLQQGFGGVRPPPWSYVPKNVGKPPKCYEPPAAGHCKRSIQRYGYNPYTDECTTFHYSGCGGNQNNFVSKLLCEQSCINPVVGGCAP